MTSQPSPASGSLPMARVRAASFQRPAVFIINRLGDQLMALPAVRALCALYPQGVQLLLGEDMRAFFYRGLPVGEPVRLRWSGEGERGVDVERAARTATGCDLLVCLSPDPISLVGPLAARLGATWTMGYGEGLDHRLYLRDGVHVFDSQFAIARCLEPALRLEEFSAPPAFSPAAERAAQEFLATARRSRPRLLFVHPETAADRMWDRSRLAWVLDRFLAARPDFMALVASLEPVELDDQGGRVRWINGHLELTLALLRHMDLFLGVDSLFLHAADLCRIPGLALFGPTPAWQKGFRFSPHGRHVSAGSMDGILPEPVLDALLDVARCGAPAAGGGARRGSRASRPATVPLPDEQSAGEAGARAGRGAAALRRRLAEQGYCVIPDFLPLDELEALRSATRRYPEQLRGDAPSDGYTVDWDGEGRIRQIYDADALNPTLDRLLRSDRALELLRGVFGHDIGLYHAKFILKDPGGSAIPWHQDYSYWQGHSDGPCQINLMVYLDDADEENGCLLVVPGSHREDLAPHRTSDTHGAFYASLPDVDPSRVVAVPGRAGTAILFGPLLRHASGPNRSSRPRHSFTVVYTNPLLDHHRGVLSRFFPQERIKALAGPGPFGFCAEHFQRRNLWHLALHHVTEPEWNWLEITDRTFNDGSFEWLSARKHPRAAYHRFEVFPLAASNRGDVTVRAGPLPDTLAELRGPLGLVFLDCERAVNARRALTVLAGAVREGTVLVIDNYYNFPGWQRGPYREFQRFIMETGLGFDYLGRSPQQVAVRLTRGEPCGCPAITWQPVSGRIVYE